MSVPAPVKRYTPQEYLALERDAGYKSDYYNGEIFAMSGGTIRHSLISMNIGREVGNRLKGKPCRAYESNLRLNCRSTGLWTYPDVSVYCGPLQRDPDDPAGETVTNPTVLFEGLSKSTEAYGRGFKAENYRRIDSLKAYVLVSQDRYHVEIYERQGDGAWLLREERGIEAILAITAIDIDLPLAEIYDGVDFTNP
jgi:Uma2 family endonuclease